MRTNPRRTVLLFFFPLCFFLLCLDGKFHRLKVTLSAREKLSVQARPGYYAGKAQGAQ